MRLTHLKLAGFKSFVDPTTIHLHGQRVGVVGPNGCGKSNVMESVRWVLGESSAKEMRADAMDAVIFNGSSNRKPISRASVELVFDNSLGSANGEWGQYAEIAVKRVIEREKGSTYYINNAAVRRRDVADLFLGTGLGGRAYAIIGQNTISRIVEAKPEDLRIFLEEAAGISKYKDRRRETELRLRDTRENLMRVEDICRELQKQITRLESQAVITQQYHAWQAALKLAEGQLWLLKKRDASREWEKTKTQVEKLVNRLEAQVADLRKCESKLELCRQSFYAASEHINQAQAAYYEANAEVANLENQLKQNHEARERIAQQIQLLSQSINKNEQTLSLAQQRLLDFKTDLENAAALENSNNTALSALKNNAETQDSELRLALNQAQTSQQNLNQSKQRVEIENNNIQYLSKTLDENAQRLVRLNDDLATLVPIDSALANTHQSKLNTVQQQSEQLEATLQNLRQQEADLQAHLVRSRDTLNQHQRDLTQAEAEIRSLLKLQQTLNSEQHLLSWLKTQGFADKARLWQKIQLDKTWNVAIEAVLGERLNAVISDGIIGDIQAQARPPGALAMGFAGAESLDGKPGKTHELQPLLQMISHIPEALAGVLEDWLANIYCLPENMPLAEAKKHLRPGEQLVNRQGDIFSCHGVVYYGKNSHLHGVLARQQQLSNLQAQLPKLEQASLLATQQLADDEQKVSRIRLQHQQESQQLKTVMQLVHEQQMAISRLQQAEATNLAREKSIQVEINKAQTRDAQLTADIAAKKNQSSEISAHISQFADIYSAAFERHQALLNKAEQSRHTLMDAEKSYQESVFKLRLINNNINELNNKINEISEELISFNYRKKEAEDALTLTPMDTLKANMAAAVSAKLTREAALADARNQLALEESQLQALERERLQTEQQLHPLRDQLEQSRLSEQQARLYFEQCHAGLLDNGLDERLLSANLQDDTKVGAMLAKTQQLQQKIIDLGAVNLAAIQELANETERKTYLDSQMLDLTQATETLEQAIGKIDRETREKLLNTFHTANQHFAELFATLFGGGQARLELLGEEILDTGLQVFAQPPGKKNTTIQLLSGGEKALTALALVFALFRLNPAPFCLMDEVDAPLDDSNTERFCAMVKKMSEKTQFLFVSHNKITMEMAQQLIGVTMQESGVSRIVDVDIEAALQMQA